MASQLETYSRLTCFRKCSNLHQFCKKAEAVSFFVAMLECLYHIHTELSLFKASVLLEMVLPLSAYPVLLKLDARTSNKMVGSDTPSPETCV